jgi:Tfp pilus assembly protein PilO
MLVDIDGKQGLVRDINSRAILNINKTEYENYLTRRRQQREDLKKMTQQEHEINNLKQDMAEIKQLLQALLRQNNG